MHSSGFQGRSKQVVTCQGQTESARGLLKFSEANCANSCRLLANFGMTPFELGSVGSLMPGSVEEARALVQTLEVCLFRSLLERVQRLPLSHPSKGFPVCLSRTFLSLGRWSLCVLGLLN